MLSLEFNLGYISPLLFLDEMCATFRLPPTFKALAYTISELYLMEKESTALVSSEFARCVLLVANDYIDE